MNATQLTKGRTKRSRAAGICRAIWSALVVVGLLAAAPALASSCPDPLGDVNGNGVRNVVDLQCSIVTSLFQLMAMPGDPPPSCLGGAVSNADVDCTGAVNISDAQLIATLILGDSISAAIDGDANGCPDACETAPEQSADAIAVPAFFSGTAAGGGLQLKTLAPGPVGSGGSASNANFELTTRAVGAP